LILLGLNPSPPKTLLRSLFFPVAEEHNWSKRVFLFLNTFFPKVGRDFGYLNAVYAFLRDKDEEGEVSSCDKNPTLVL